ncbi:DUF1127 domain-containing protein [Bradyrhizobium sp. PMVTL-01]|uniref:DUF1127 domain-containing protein n=1 Tax=Bradyrhizobium sp. PMVTL-01 TaxID=3434999 RepID=UPI003F72CAC5
MPPQLTNTTSEPEVDSARLRFDFSIASSLLGRYWRAFQGWRQRPRVTLHHLSDRELMDIGLTRGEIDCIAPERAIERLRDRTTDLWRRSGM